MGALLLLSEFKRSRVKAANRNTFCAMHPHVLLPPESSVGEIFNILLACYQWLCGFNTPTAHGSPRQDPSRPAAPASEAAAASQRGRILPTRLLCWEGVREQALGRGGHSRAGDMQGAGLSPATPHQHGGSPGRMSIRLQPEGHRPLVLLHKQPTCQMSQQRSKTNKQQLQLLGFLVLTHYSLILETWLSGAASLLLLLLRENRLPAQPDRQPPAFRADVSFPFLKIWAVQFCWGP